MHIGIPQEIRSGETRVAATPETVKKLVAQGHRVTLQQGAGTAAYFFDDAYREAGASIGDAATALGADIVLKVRAPLPTEWPLLKAGATLVGMLDPFESEQLQGLAATGITGFALEAAPRTTRAQALDVLSSQANIAGYRAVLLATTLYPRFMPMLMTAAGTVKAARLLVLGAGVAGLQAIATAKRLGAVVEASDVRPAVKEQIESLGAKFVDVPFETDEERAAAEGVGGYARPMPASWMRRQAERVHERAKQADIIISTALIPGRAAPTLIPAETVRAMKAGSVIIDLAAGRGPLVEPSELNDMDQADRADAGDLRHATEGSIGAGASVGADLPRRGGNCPLSEADRIVVRHGVQIVGHTNLPAAVPTDASALYARNVLDFLKLIVDANGQLLIDTSDDIVAATLVCRDGALSRAPAGA
ncbi:MAG: NAD(P) transhydrogenase subunit alpha [Janthinobacterium lividum]